MQHNNSLLTQQERLTAVLLTTTSQNNCKSRKKDVIQMKSKIQQERILAKWGICKANKLPMKKNQPRVIQPIEIKHRSSPLETEDSPTKNENTRPDSPNTKITAKQNGINTATQNTQNSNDKTESDTLEKRKLPVSVIRGYFMVKDIKSWKMSSRTCKVVVKHFSSAKTKDMKSCVIPIVEQKTDNIILHTGTNDSKIIGTPEKITMEILNLTMTCKTDTVFLYLVLSHNLTGLIRKLQK